MYQILPWMERQSDHFVKIIQMDGGTEYLDSVQQETFKNKGIELRTTIKGTPQMNGQTERLVRTITTLTNACLIGSGLGDEFWADAIRYLCFVHNRLPRPELNMKSAREVFLNKPHLSLARFPKFGHRCFAYINPDPTKKMPKFTNRGVEGKFIG
jgi:transposase InsO family protein